MIFAAATALAVFSLAAIPARGAVHQVTVGGPGILAYNPETVVASPGDTVIFTFMQKNHTATQSSFEDPCTQIEGGFDSGFQPVADNNTSGPFPQAQLTIQDTNPIWVYCRQTGHCAQGMVFAVNPGSQFSAFQAAANATGSASASSASGVVTVTATVTEGGESVTTTYGSYPGSASPTSVTSTDHFIVVGGTGKLFYSPANISAQIGDTITFQFQQKNHTVTQSSFADPCRALTLTSTTGQVGFDSGFMPVADNATSFPTYTIQVNDTAPIWAYCRQTGHCGQGMVFAANAVESGPNNFEAFEALAKQLNGTATAASPSATSANSAMSVHLRSGAGVVFGIVFVLLGSLL